MIEQFDQLQLIGLLFILAFLLGYFLSRRKSKKKRYQLRFSNDYFQGLNYLLNDEQDKALEIFLKLVEVDWETIDTSLALGSIFRRKGELDKSIKLHQSLLARPSLPQEYKSRVLLELARDYQLAGWLDRAEGLYNEVLKDDIFALDALKYLMSIYQQEHEWNAAINIARRYQRKGKENLRPVIAQYFCELSEQALDNGDGKQAEALATQALSEDENCVRSSIILGSLAMDRGAYKRAIRFLQQVEFQNIEFMPLIIDKLAECYRNQSNLKSLITYLKSLERTYDNISFIPYLSDLINEIYGRQSAHDYLASNIIEKPSLEGMKKALELQDKDDHATDEFLPKVLEVMIRKKPDFQCSHCGYSANTLYWLCPSCHTWAGMKPKLSEKIND
ncbi:MAG: lipopolysaccharide assembly protein LapB [Gammaproteobacteria bacterium]